MADISGSNFIFYFSKLDSEPYCIQSVVQGGDTYVFDPSTTYDSAKEYVIGPKIATFVAVLEDEGGHEQILGFYKLIANQRDLGSHVSNASFMVSPLARGKGVGRQLVGHFTLTPNGIAFLLHIQCSPL